MTNYSPIPVHLGKYEIISELGRGGFGVVYRARDSELDREIALKVIHPQLLVDSSFVQRFYEEARIAAGLDHPSIVHINNVGEAEGRLFIDMTLLEGVTLHQRIAEVGRLAPDSAVAILSQVAEAVDYAHSKNVLHRDLKPANIIVRSDGHTTLTDFGLAKAHSESRISSREQQVGTLLYMAPEQFDPSLGEICRQTDLYALGIVVYEMLSGHPPFEGISTQVMHGHVSRQPPRLEDMTPAISNLLDRALAKKPTDRFSSAAELVDALRQSGREATLLTEQEHTSLSPGGQGKGDGRREDTSREQPTPEAPAGAIKVLGSSGITLVYAPGGGFLLGSADGDVLAAPDEKPRHSARVQGFWMGSTPVTNAQYRHFIEAKGYDSREYWSEEGWQWKQDMDASAPKYWDSPLWNSDACPVVGVSWYEAEAFARWAGGRLPTEAEWEYAARGGPLTKGLGYSGSDNASDVAWYGENSSGHTSPVALKKANELGLCDMSGNVWEWVQDEYGPYPDRGSSQSPQGGQRVLRGGSWFCPATMVRCACRSKSSPETRYDDIGFRVAC
ncbi:MAG TPA: bifunctional serine/threonine-protein kinase/formylglycine-generating enzyme family protein [Anaerolineae bacterium]|nr:bifunctional serine/threonine-protein kinase/formylglycine-generating enzyme family protein [Anaerolineae bacterium]